jgi:EAL domain-containing protein (putative c-di-GMP-specific phosphodiesterase class I)
MAMYASKRPGAQSITVYEARMAGDSGGIFSTSANEAVYSAIEKGEGIRMHYQPVASTVGGGISYYESLLRLELGGRMIFPGEIFPVVESRHLELDLDRAVMGQVLADLDAGLVPQGTGVSINLSASSIVHDDIVDWLRPFVGFLDRYRLVIEITETSLITQLEAARDNLAELRRLGFWVALDDFGSGYSSLRYLTSMPVDVVKFDISLIHALENPSQRRLVNYLVEVIKDAGQQVVAEGIETEAMLQRVTEVGFGCVQGYLVGHPEPRPVQHGDALSASSA